MENVFFFFSPSIEGKMISNPERITVNIFLTRSVRKESNENKHYFGLKIIRLNVEN